MIPKVLNKYTDIIPSGAVYVGRGSIWGNPFKIGSDGTREEVIEKYKTHFYTSGLGKASYVLIGKDLVCFCAPKACHADFLLEVVNPKCAS